MKYSVFNSIASKSKTALVRLADKSRHFKNHTGGVAAIEMALIFPVMILFLYGLVDVTDAMSRSRKVTITANTIGDLVTQEPGTTTKANLDGIFDSALEVMAPYDGSTMGVAVYDFRPDNHGNPKLEWQHKTGLNCGGAPVPDNKMKQLMSQGNDIVVTKACYNFHYITGKLFSTSTIKMKEEMTLRPRKSLQLDCSNC